MLLEASANIKRLGHSTSKIIIDIYSNITNKMSNNSIRPVLPEPLLPKLPTISDITCPIQLQNPENNFAIKLPPLSGDSKSDVSITHKIVSPLDLSYFIFCE